MVKTTFRKRKNRDIAIFKDGEFKGSFNINTNVIGVHNNDARLKAELRKEVKRRLRK